MNSLKHSLKKERIAIFVVGLIAGALLGGTFHKETIIVREGTADTPAALTSVNLMIDDGHGNVKTWNTVSWHEAMSVMDLLDLVASTGNITYTTSADRTKVVSVNGVSTTGTSTERWQFWVNNTYEPKIPNKYYLKPGDIVLWKFVTVQAS
jgi:hypothetical protein